MKVCVATPSPLRRRVERVIAAEAGVVIVDVGAVRSVDIAAVHGSVPDHVEVGRIVPMPVDPLAHLAGLVADRACAAAGTDRADFLAMTTTGTQPGTGIAVTFPPPVGALWAHREGEHLVAPVPGDLAGIAVAATGPKGTVRLGVVDMHDFVVAIALAAPVLAEITGRDELAAAEAAGLDVAEFVATT